MKLFWISYPSVSRNFLSCIANGRAVIERFGANHFSLSFRSFSAPCFWLKVRSDVVPNQPCHLPSSLRYFVPPKDCFRYQLLHQRLIGENFSTTDDVRAVAWVDADSFSLKNLGTLLEVGVWGFWAEGIFPPKCGGDFFKTGIPCLQKMPRNIQVEELQVSFPRKVGMNEVSSLWGTPFVRVPFGYVSGGIFCLYKVFHAFLSLRNVSWVTWKKNKENKTTPSPPKKTHNKLDLLF